MTTMEEIKQENFNPEQLVKHWIEKLNKTNKNGKIPKSPESNYEFVLDILKETMLKTEPKLLGKNISLTTETVFQPIMGLEEVVENNETVLKEYISKYEALTELVVKDNDTGEIIGGYNYQYKETLLFFLSDYCNGDVIVDENGMLKKDVFFNTVHKLVKNKTIDNHLNEATKQGLTNYLFQRNAIDTLERIESLANYKLIQRTKKEIDGKEENIVKEFKTHDKDFLVSLNIGKNEFTPEFLKSFISTLRKQPNGTQLLKDVTDYFQLELLEHPHHFLDKEGLSLKEISDYQKSM
jgi:hypothetical protein